MKKLLLIFTLFATPLAASTNRSFSCYAINLDLGEDVRFNMQIDPVNKKAWVGDHKYSKSSNPNNMLFYELFVLLSNQDYLLSIDRTQTKNNLFYTAAGKEFKGTCTIDTVWKPLF